MQNWLKRLFNSPSKDLAPVPQPASTEPGDLISRLVASMLEDERRAAARGDSAAASTLAKRRKEIEALLRSEPIVGRRAQMLGEDLLDRRGRSHGSGSSSPICDVRVKQNVRPLRHPLDIAMALRGVEFDWRHQEYPELGLERFPEIGFIAQEVETVLPTVVRENEEGYKTINYACLVPVLIEAMKEQQLSIRKLQDRVQGLEAQRRALDAPVGM